MILSEGVLRLLCSLRRVCGRSDANYRHRGIVPGSQVCERFAMYLYLYYKGASVTLLLGMPALGASIISHILHQVWPIARRGYPLRQPESRSYGCDQRSSARDNEKRTGYLHDDICVSCEVSKPVCGEHHSLASSQITETLEEVCRCLFRSSNQVDMN